MRIDSQALRRHAAEVCSEGVLRTRGRLRRLSAAELSAVEETAQSVGQAVACCLLESAASDESLEAVLAGLYPSVGNGAAPG
jgi:hypothetical protein